MGLWLKNSPQIKVNYLFQYFPATNLTSFPVAATGRIFGYAFDVLEPQVIDGIYIFNYAVVAGNVRAAIYKQVTQGTAIGSILVCESADIVLAGASGAQFIPLPNTRLSAGTYYMATQYSDVTHTVGANTNVEYLLGCAAGFYCANTGGLYNAFLSPIVAETNAPHYLANVVRCKA